MSPAYRGCTFFWMAVLTPGSAVAQDHTGGQRETEVVQWLRALRAQLDQTVWAREGEAQVCEDTFVWLWDNLRRKDDVTRIVTGDSFRAQHSLTKHFGLGRSTDTTAFELATLLGRSRSVR